MAITPLPTPPSRSTPSTFSTLADAFLAALATFVTEANAQAAALELNSTTSTSTTSLAIGTGSKSLTVDLAKSYQPGMSVKIARTASPSNWMYGDVTSYNAGTGALVVNVLSVLGSGTYTDWTITFSAPNGLPVATAENDIIMAGPTPFTWIKKTLVELRDKIFTVGADADGDMYYRSSGVLTRFPKGAANLKIFMNAAGALPEWANGIKVKSFERDLSAAGAPTDVAYTGWGFKPSALILYGIVSPGTPAGDSMGFYANGTNSCDGHQNTTMLGHGSANLGAFHESVGNRQECIVKSMDSDGFTLTWTKTGSPTAWVYGTIIALR